ncbi:NAD+ synthase [Candidatus Bipolaricaulota sp. J31]
MTEGLRIAIAQINPIVGDLEGNLCKAREAIEEARRRGVDLLVFPELFLLGYPPRDLLLRPDFVVAARGVLEGIAAATEGVAVVIGHIAEGEPREANRADPSARAFGAGRTLFNVAYLIADGEILGFQAKERLPSFDVFEEERYFTPAREISPLEWRDLRLGLSVCEDFWYEGGVIEEEIRAGVDLLVNVSASPYFTGKPAIRWELGRRWATRAGVPLVYANLVGGQDELVFDGHSFVIRPDGAFLLAAPGFEQGLFVCDLAGEPVEEPREAGISDIYRAIVLGIRDYLDKNGLKGAVVGVSGGIDSAVVLSLAAAALGPDRVRAVFLPGPYTAPESREGAQAVAGNLGVELVEVSIVEIYEAILAGLRGVVDTSGVVGENLQARIRGLILMAFANALGYAVLCPGNKSEVAMGYNTLYGDTVGALAPIGDLLKEEVYQLGHHINERHGREIIPEAIFRRPPTAELRPGQRDDQDLPSYSVLDPFLRAFLVENLPAEKLSSSFGDGLVREAIRRVYRAEYKRKQLPPVIKVSPKAFGMGRRFPLTNRFRDL